MNAHRTNLLAEVVRLPPRPGAAPAACAPAGPALSDVALTSIILLVGAIPLAAQLGGHGDWLGWELGVSAACSLLAVRELARQLWWLARARTRWASGAALPPAPGERSSSRRAS